MMEEKKLLVSREQRVLNMIDKLSVVLLMLGRYERDFGKSDFAEFCIKTLDDAMERLFTEAKDA